MRGQHADRGDVREHHVVDVKTIQYGIPPVCIAASNALHAGDGEEQADAAADEAEHHALDQQLTDDAPARGAEGDADGDLARPMRRAREQQVGDVRAGDEQHEARRRPSP